MSFSFRSNLSSNNIITQLARTSGSLSKNFERLSSGLRINRASDDAAGLALASSLSVDARVFTQGVRNVNDGISLANLAESALTELQNITSRQAELVNQAANGTLTHSQRQALNSEANALVDEFNRIVNTTEFNGVKLLDNTFGTSSVQAEQGASGNISFALASELARTTGTGSFQAAVSYATGTNPFAVDTGDFNGDGNLDFVVCNHNNATVTVTLNNGNGTFASPATYAVGSNTRGVVTGDLNNDGVIDLAVGASGNDSVYVLLGNGNGTFQTGVSYAVGDSPLIVDMADFNEDGYMDIVAENYTDNNVAILINNGNGTFASAVTYSAGGVSQLYSVVASDLNGDGHIDLATASMGSDKISVLMGNGDGTFQSAVTYASGSTPRSIMAADFNRDGYTDLVTADYGDNRVSVYLNDGSGTFSTRVSYQTGTGPNGVTVADMNGDGYKDIVTGDYSGHTVSLLLGNGNGTFQASASFASYGSYGPVLVATGDFSNDGALEILTVNSNLNKATILSPNTITRTTAPVLNLQTQADALESITVIEAQKNRVGNELGKVGAAQGRFESAVNLLRNKRENYDAAVSRIQDVDVASEFADMVRNKIMQQTQRALLAQSNNLTAEMVSVLLDDEQQ